MPPPHRLALTLPCLLALACAPADTTMAPAAAPESPGSARTPAPVAPAPLPPPAAEPAATITPEPAAAPPPAKPPEEDRTTWQVPVGTSPVRGKASALVTLVEFADFECKFSGRVTPTLAQLEREYGDQLRVVYKELPLPFHTRAAPAAELALEARAQRGEAGFWSAHDLLFAKECSGSPQLHERQACMDAGGTWRDHQLHLEDADLLDHGKALHLDAGKLKAALDGQRYAATIDDDVALSEDLHVQGTPNFFINGRHLMGAQPIETFRALIDEELEKARALVKGGVAPAAVYAKLQSTAKAPDAPERRALPAPTAENPGRGPADARVTVQVFGDFQCAFCKQAMSTLAALEQAFPGKIRIVWRNTPLSTHPGAALAAEAAMEAFRQKGDAGFWAMQALLYENQDHPGGLERPALVAYAGTIGLDAGPFTAALDSHRHKAAIDADQKVAADAHVTGTPSFAINGYFLAGAQPLSRFKRLVKQALTAAK